MSSEEDRSESEWGTACTDVFERAQLNRVIQDKKWPDAKQIANGLIARCPEIGIGQYWAGIIEFKQGNFIAALRYFEAAVDRAPAVSRVHLNLGEAYLMINQFKLYEDEMLWLTTHDPKNPLPFYYLGRYYSKRFDDPQEKASMFFEQALVRNPRDYQSRYHLGIYLRTKRFNRDGEEGVPSRLARSRFREGELFLAPARTGSPLFFRKTNAPRIEIRGRSSFGERQSTGQLSDNR